MASSSPISGNGFGVTIDLGHSTTSLSFASTVFDTRTATYLEGAPTTPKPNEVFYRLAPAMPLAGNALWRPTQNDTEGMSVPVEKATVQTQHGPTQVSFCLLEDTFSVPANIFSILLPPLRSTIDDYYLTDRKPSESKRAQLMRGLILMEAAYCAENSRRSKSKFKPHYTACQNFESVNQDGADGADIVREIVFLWSMYHLRRSDGLSGLHKILNGVEDYGTLTYAIAEESGVPAPLIASVGLKRSKDHVLFPNRTPFHYIDYLLLLLRMTRHPDPWKVLGKLEKEGFQMGFGIAPAKASDLRCPRHKVDELRRIGLGGLIHEARSKRGWNLQTLKASIDRLRKPLEGIDYQRLTRILNYRECADTLTLTHILAGINADLEKPLIASEDAFIVNWPYLPYLAGETVSQGWEAAKVAARSCRRSRTNDDKIKTAKVVSSKAELDPRGFAFLLRSASYRKSWGSKQLAQKLGVGEAVVDRLFQDPIIGEDGIALYTPSREVLTAVTDTKALGLKRQKTLTTTHHSYWSMYPPARRIHRRSLWGPIFFDSHFRDRMEAYAQTDTISQGEFLFTLRNSARPSQRNKKLFLPNLREFAQEVGIPFNDYELYERNQRPLTNKEIDSITQALGLEESQKDLLTKLAEDQHSHHASIRKEEMIRLYPHWVDHEGILSFLSQLRMQWQPHEMNYDDVAEKLKWLQAHDPISFRYIEQKGAALTGADKETTNRLYVSFWRSYKFLQNWRKAIERNGPAIAFYYENYRGAESVFMRLQRALQNSHTQMISFEENGIWQATKKTVTPS